MKAAVSLVVALCVSGCALNRPPVPPGADQWVRVTALTPGIPVRIRWYDVSVANVPIVRISGRLVSTSDEAVVVEVQRRRVVVPRAHVQRIDTLHPTKDSLKNGVATGAAVGLGYGAFVIGTTAESSDPVGGRVMILTTVVGAGIGALIDSAREGRVVRTVYMRPARGGSR